MSREHRATVAAAAALPFCSLFPASSPAQPCVVLLSCARRARRGPSFQPVRERPGSLDDAARRSCVRAHKETAVCDNGVRSVPQRSGWQADWRVQLLQRWAGWYAAAGEQVGKVAGNPRWMYQCTTVCTRLQYSTGTRGYYVGTPGATHTARCIAQSAFAPASQSMPAAAAWREPCQPASLLLLHALWCSRVAWAAASGERTINGLHVDLRIESTMTTDLDS